MNKDINKYKNKRRLFKFLTVVGFGITAVATFSVLWMVMNTAILSTVIVTGIIAVGSAYAADFASDNKDACDQVIRQLELKERLKTFTLEEKKILSNAVKSSSNEDYKNNTINNISIKDNIGIIEERFNLLRDASLSDNILSLVNDIPSKYGDVSNLEAALTTADNIPVDVIYKTEKLKVKQKKKQR